MLIHRLSNTGTEWTISVFLPVQCSYALYSCKVRKCTQVLKGKSYPFQWAGQLSRYSDCLRAGRSGDRIPVAARFSAPVQTGPGAHPASCTMGAGSFPGGKERPGLETDPSLPSSAAIMKGQSYTSTPAMGRTACTESECLYKGDLYLTFTYLHILSAYFFPATV